MEIPACAGKTTKKPRGLTRTAFRFDRLTDLEGPCLH